GAAAGVLVVLSGLAAESHEPTMTASRTIIWWAWQPLVIATVVVVVGYLRTARPKPITSLASHEGHHPPAWLWLVPALAALNGLTPYLEVKTAYGWNMYSNLSMVDGKSNHFVFRAGLPLTDEQSDVVEITSSPDPRLQFYADNDLV